MTMTDPIKAFLQPGSLETTAFPTTSRYYGIETASMETVEGKTIVYLSRRFVPPPERFALLQEHTVTQGDRPDNLANQYLGDPEQFWRLCDANNVKDPDELTETVGRRIKITLPEGIQGSTNG
jgi:hypothetical protein